METDEAGLLSLDLRIVDKIELARNFILNELSHDTFVNIYRKELEDAIAGGGRTRRCISSGVNRVAGSHSRLTATFTTFAAFRSISQGEVDKAIADYTQTFLHLSVPVRCRCRELVR